MMGNKIDMNMEEIISSDEIKLILDRYRIGKKPLAKLLGWGETTIIRYMEGDIPTNEYSSKLRRILNDPEYYYDLLCQKRDFLTSVAYRKSKKAVMSKIMASRVYAVAYYIVNKCNADICPGYIQHLLYYAQAFSLALNSKELFQDECGINAEQMPYLKLYESMKQCGVHKLEGVEEYLIQEDIELINGVLDCFMWFGPKALKALIAYEKASMKPSRDKYNNKIFSKDSLKNYFTDIIEKYDIHSINEIYKYPEQRVNEIKDLSR